MPWASVNTSPPATLAVLGPPGSTLVAAAHPPSASRRMPPTPGPNRIITYSPAPEGSPEHPRHKLADAGPGDDRRLRVYGAERHVYALPVPTRQAGAAAAEAAVSGNQRTGGRILIDQLRL